MSENLKATAPEVGDNIIAMRSNWTFGGDTARNFMSHVKRSVPLYEEGHNLVCELSDFFVHTGSICYEIGVSTGDTRLGSLQVN